MVAATHAPGIPSACTIGRDLTGLHVVSNALDMLERAMLPPDLVCLNRHAATCFQIRFRDRKHKSVGILTHDPTTERLGRFSRSGEVLARSNALPSPDTSSGTPDAGGIRSRPGEISGLGASPHLRLPACCPMDISRKVLVLLDSGNLDNVDIQSDRRLAHEGPIPCDPRVTEAASRTVQPMEQQIPIFCRSKKYEKRLGPTIGKQEGAGRRPLWGWARVSYC